MIRRLQEMSTEVRPNMRGGRGNVEITHIFKQNELGGKCRLLARVTLPVGASIGQHEHMGEEEVFYIIRGKGRVTDSGVTAEVSEGDAVLTGAGAGHSIENIGDEPLVMTATILLY